jgi:hypothetical protein
MSVGSPPRIDGARRLRALDLGTAMLLDPRPYRWEIRVHNAFAHAVQVFTFAVCASPSSRAVT